jgi:hypothetical protein
MLIAQITLDVIIGGLTLALLVTSFIMWVQSQKGRSGNKRLALGLFIAGVVIVVALVAVVAAH